MSKVFKLRRRGQEMYGEGVYCSSCEKWFIVSECHVGKNNVLLCPICHKIARRNKRG